MSTELLPCPFCGGGQTSIKENGKVWTGMRWSEPSSVSVRHWCEPITGQPLSRRIERVGRDEESAIAAWNRRPSADAAQLAIYVKQADERGDEAMRRAHAWEKVAVESGDWLPDADGFPRRSASKVSADAGAAGVPQGWKLVPIEATQEMLNNGHKAKGHVRGTWSAMLRASPTAPALQKQQDETGHQD